MADSISVVTGGTRGIGLGIAECLVKRNASIAITYRRDDQAAARAHQKLNKLVHNDQKIFLLKGDAGDPEIVASHYQTIRNELGPVTILVNNAGIMPSKSFDEISIDQWKETLRINLDSAFYWCHKVIPEMKQLNFGRIINISSIAARGGGVIGPHYAAAKAGLLGLTRYGARAIEYLLDSPFVTGVTLDINGGAFMI